MTDNTQANLAAQLARIERWAEEIRSALKFHNDAPLCRENARQIVETATASLATLKQDDQAEPRWKEMSQPCIEPALIL